MDGNRFFRTVTLSVSLVLLSLSHFAQTCEAWKWVNPSPQGNNLNSITYGNGLWVGVGDYGTIITSPDGESWTVRKTGVTNNLKDAVWGDGKWVVVGWQGTVLTSTDGVIWSLGPSGGYYNSFDTVVYGGGLFVASGTSYATWTETSPDGLIWTPRIWGGFTDLLWDGERFIGSCCVWCGAYSSTDGITWTRIAAGAPPFIAWNGSHYVGPGYDGFWVSPDAVNWTTYPLDDYPTITSICWGGGRFVAVGHYGEGWNATGVSLAGPDGMTWAQHALDGPGTPTGVASGAGKFITVGWGGFLRTSEDGASWSGSNSQTEMDLTRVVWVGAQFVALGQRYDWGVPGGWSEATFTSPDGFSWTPRWNGTGGYLYDVAWNGSRYVAVGYRILTSADGIEWTEQALPQHHYLTTVTWAQGQFVALGMIWDPESPQGIVYTSPDGITWTMQSAPVEPWINRVIWTGTKYLAAGAGFAATSADGISWSTVRFDKGYILQDVLWDGQTFIACGYLGIDPDGLVAVILTSRDGSTWDAYFGPASPGGTDFTGVSTLSNGRIGVVGGYGEIVTSRDGVSWVTEETGTRARFLSIANNGDHAIITGSGGVIFSESCGFWPALPGDCDGDRNVTIGELQHAIGMFLGTQGSGCGADCDIDGAISIGEVQKVVNAFLGLPSSC